MRKPTAIMSVLFGFKLALANDAWDPPSEYFGCGEPLCVPEGFELDPSEYYEWFEGLDSVLLANLPGGRDPLKEASIFVLSIAPEFQGSFHHHTSAYHGVMLSGVQRHLVKKRNGRESRKILRAGDYFHSPAGQIQRHDVVGNEPIVILFYFYEGLLDIVNEPVEKPGCKTHRKHPTIPRKQMASGAEWCNNRAQWVRCVEGETETLLSKRGICDPQHPEVPGVHNPSEFNGCGHALCLPPDLDVDAFEYFEYDTGADIALLPGMGDPRVGEAVFLLKVHPEFEGFVHYHPSRFYGVMASGSQKYLTWGRDTSSQPQEYTYDHGDYFEADAGIVMLNVVIDDEGFVMLLWFTGKLEFIPAPALE